ncbi:MAG: hypothetical protein LBF66_00870 [Holosporales bacterium]|jgi:hypothetical protein|nr:hypothetical protein [Holosporales bacterium]
MPQSYVITDLPGKKPVKMATTDVAPLDDITVRSPEWMIKIDDLLSSNLSGFEDYSEIFGWNEESSRFTPGNLSNQLLGSATLKHSGLTVLISNGGHSAQIELKMNRGIPLDLIEIVRLGNIQDSKVKLQILEYHTCWIQSFQQQLDRVIVTVSISIKKNTVYVFDNSGANTGQMVSEVNYIQGMVEG